MSARMRLALATTGLGHRSRWARVQALDVAGRALDGLVLGLDRAGAATGRTTSPTLWAVGDVVGAAVVVVDRAARRTHEAWLRAGLVWEQRLSEDRCGLPVFAALAAGRGWTEQEQGCESGTTQEVQV